MTVRRCWKTRQLCQQQQSALNMLDSMMNDGTIFVRKVDSNGFVTWLDITDTTISTLPADFGSMFPELNTLDLDNCANLTHVSSIGGMRKLRELCLYMCPVLRAFPEELCERLKKSELLHCNAFDYDSSNIRNLEGLEEFKFMDDDLEQVPLAVWSLSNVKRLNLIGATLTGIPKYMGNLAHLEELRVIGKNIMLISPEIGALVHLRNIEFRLGEITELPDEMGELTALERVDLSNCWNLKRIPTPVLQLPHLEYLDLTGCDSLSIPTRDILKCTNSLIEFEPGYEREHTSSEDLKRSCELLWYMVHLNKDGRYLLKEKDVSLALWGSAICHWSKNVDSLFYFLKQKPDVIPKDSRKRKVAT